MALVLVPELVVVPERTVAAVPGDRRRTVGDSGMGDRAIGGRATGDQAGSERAVSERALERAEARARRLASASVDGSLADLELTRRGRWVLWSMAVAVATGVAVMGGGALASTPDVPQAVVPYTVSEGDNLWGIAEGLALPGEDLRDVVDLIVEVNDRSTAALWAGEQILLPVREGA